MWEEDVLDVMAEGSDDDLLVIDEDARTPESTQAKDEEQPFLNNEEEDLDDFIRPVHALPSTSQVNSSRPSPGAGGNPTAVLIMEDGDSRRPGSPGGSVLSSTSARSAKSLKQASSNAGDGDSAPAPKKAKKSSLSGGSKKKSCSKKSSHRTKPCRKNLNDPSDDDEEQAGEETYVVEKICGKKLVGGAPFYFIKWQGWEATHNTWEPVSNLDGCHGLLEKFEKSEAERKRKGGRKNEAGFSGRTMSESGSVQDDPLVDSKENSYKDLEEMRKTRNELVEYGIAKSWPPERTPVQVIGVWTIDGRLTYIVRCQTNETDGMENPPLTYKNVTLVLASAFKAKFPQLVIRFYEDRLNWGLRAPVDRLEQKIAQVMAERQVGELDAENNPGKALKELKQNRSANTSSATTGNEPCSSKSVLTPAVVNNAQDVREEIMDVDDIEDDDEDEVPKIRIRSDIDLFGLPMDVSTESTSTEYESASGPKPTGSKMK